MDEIEEMEAEMHRVIDEPDCNPALKELMRQLWMQHLDMKRQQRAHPLH